MDLGRETNIIVVKFISEFFQSDLSVSKELHCILSLRTFIFASTREKKTPKKSLSSLWQIRCFKVSDFQKVRGLLGFSLNSEKVKVDNSFP